MNRAAGSQRGSTPPTQSGGLRFARGVTDAAAAGRFSPDKQALSEALHVVRALDADSYQALLWALGLTPDPRLSVPGCGQRPATASEPNRL